MDKIIKVIKVDKKLHRFKQLMSYTLATSVALAVPAATYILAKATDIHDAVAISLVFANVANLVFMAGSKLVQAMEGHKYGFNFLKGHFWYKILNKPAQKLIQKLELDIIKKIKNEEDINKLYPIYKEYQTNKALIHDWYKYTLDSGKHKKEINNWDSHIAHEREIQELFKFHQIENYLMDNVSSFREIRKQLGESYSNMSFDIKNNSYDHSRIEFLLKNKDYILSEKDYKGLASLMAVGNFNLIDSLIESQLPGIDWSRVYQDFMQHYTDLDSTYIKYKKKLSQLSGDKNPQKNKETVNKIHNIRESKKSLVLEDTLQYNANFYKDTWEKLVKQCIKIKANEGFLSLEDNAEFNEHIKHSLAAIIKIDTYLSTTEIDTPKSQKFMSQMKTNLDAIVGFSDRMIYNIENSLEKELAIVDKMINQPKSMSAKK